MRRYKSEGLLQRAARSDAWAMTRSAIREMDGANLGYPQYISRAKGPYIWDLDGNEYIDFILGYGPVILGHADCRVDAAFAATMADGICISPMWSERQVELAELLVGTIPGAQRAFLLRTGSDATAAAVRLARIFTGRDKILKWGYNGWHDWTAPRKAGIPNDVLRNTLQFEYNNIASVEAAFAEHPGGIACVIMMPFELDAPADGFLHAVRDVAHRNGALFIIDDMRSGFRLALGGSQEHFGLSADLATFSKAMANGYPISAVVGRADVLGCLAETHMTSTFFANPSEMAAATATITILRDTDALARVRRNSERFYASLQTLIGQYEPPARVRGLPISPFLEFMPTAAAAAFKVKFYEETLQRGLLLHPNHQWYVSAAHSDADIDRALDVCEQALRSVLGRTPKIRAPADEESESITVVTLTRSRPRRLERAVRSVRNQDYPGPIEHLVIIDDDPASIAVLERLPSDARRSLRWQMTHRPPDECLEGSQQRRSVYPRLGRLLNSGVRMARSRWIAFLDDDNAFEPNHLSSLFRCARESGCRAVHSARTIFDRNGNPYLDRIFPWASSAVEGRRIYDLMVRRGVWIAGTNIVQDRVDPTQSAFKNSTVAGEDDPIFLVDQNLWLIEREILRQHPYAEGLSEADLADNTCPDDKLLESLFRAGERIVSSRQPTVCYFLGGVSNGPVADIDLEK